MGPRFWHPRYRGVQHSADWGPGSTAMGPPVNAPAGFQVRDDENEHPPAGVSDHFDHCDVVLADALVMCGLHYGSPESHLQMQALVQEYTDAAVSKTINLPAEIDFAAFRAVYRDRVESAAIRRRRA